jgi:hypothetical protein
MPSGVIDFSPHWRPPAFVWERADEALLLAVGPHPLVPLFLARAPGSPAGGRLTAASMLFLEGIRYGLEHRDAWFLHRPASRCSHTDDGDGESPIRDRLARDLRGHRRAS